jgi:hypothetical protein
MAMDFESTSTQYCTRAGDDAVLDVTQLTAMAWFKMESLPSTLGADWGICGKGGSSEISYQLRVKDPDNMLSGRLSLNGADSIICTGATVLVTGVWYHAALVTNGTDARIYLNGVLDTGADNPEALVGSLAGSTLSFRVGGRSGGGTPADGLIDQTRIFSRPLSADEIMSAYISRGTDGIVHGRVAAFDMDEAAPGTVATGAGSVKDGGVNVLHLDPAGSPIYAESVLRTRRKVA